MEQKTEKIMDITLLNEAFDAFNKATENIQSSYDSLQKETAKLRLEVEDKNVKLEEMSYLLESVLMNSNSGLIAISSNGDILIKNKIAEDIELYCGKNFYSENVFKLNESGIYEFEVNNNFFRISVGKLKMDKQSGFVYILDNVTNIKKFELEKQRNEKLSLMGEMAANIAHEIRNPLGSIELFASLLSRELAKDESQKRLTDSIIKGVRTINSTISNILHFTREMKLDIQKHFVADIADDVVLYLRHLMLEKGIKFINKIDENHCIYCDSELIKQVVMNLIHNSIDAVSEGGIIVIESQETAKETLFIIQDNGSGISEDFLNKLFIPFQTTKAKGTGLGLSIVYKIIKAHKGNIIPESDGISYSKFSVKIPK